MPTKAQHAAYTPISDTPHLFACYVGRSECKHCGRLLSHLVHAPSHPPSLPADTIDTLYDIADSGAVTRDVAERLLAIIKNQTPAGHQTSIPFPTEEPTGRKFKREI